MEDTHKRMSEWGTDGVINPFKEVYDVGTLNKKRAEF